MTKNEILQKLSDYQATFNGAKKTKSARKYSCLVSFVIQPFIMIALMEFGLPFDLNGFFDFLISAILTFSVPNIIASIFYSIVSNPTKKIVEKNCVETDMREAAKKAKEAWEKFDTNVIGWRFRGIFIEIILAFILTVAILRLLYDGYTGSIAGGIIIALLAGFVGFINYFVCNAILDSKKDYKSLKTKYDEIAEIERQIVEVEKQEEIQAEKERQEAEEKERQRQEEARKQRAKEAEEKFKEIKNPDENEKLIRALADQGSVSACTYIGKKLFEKYVSNLSKLTNREKNELAINTINYLKKGDQNDITLQYFLVSIYSMSGKHPYSSMEPLLKKAREIKASGKLNECHHEGLDLLISSIIEAIDDLEKAKAIEKGLKNYLNSTSVSSNPRIYCRFYNAGLCMHDVIADRHVTCRYPNDPAGCSTCRENNGLKAIL